MEAPEIRNWQTRGIQSFDIEDALLTDVYSFGLLAWEVVKYGHRYCEMRWLHPEAREIDFFAMEKYLNQLPRDGLLAKGLDFLGSSCIEKAVLDRVSAVIKSCLPDVPRQRSRMSRVVAIWEDSTLDENTQSESCNSAAETDGLCDFSGNGEDSVVSWNAVSSFYELIYRRLDVGASDLLEDVPETLQRRVRAEMESLASSEITPKRFRSHAAMTVSECHTVGFGGSIDAAKALHWLGVAASNGCPKAILYYHRVCTALGAEPENISGAMDGLLAEQQLASVEPDLYLIARIHYYSARAIEEARHVADQEQILEQDHLFNSDFVMSLSLFGGDRIDQLRRIHVACLLGDDDSVKLLLKHTDEAAESALGFNAVHFACLSGSLSTLRILLGASVPVKPAKFHRITPLHLAILFSVEDMPAAVALLQLERDLVDISTERELRWEAHDLALNGTPLMWAISTRHRAMVQVLLPKYPSLDFAYLFQAIYYCYWELVEDLCPLFRDGPDISHLFDIMTASRRPFASWIAHGPQYISNAQQTIKHCKELMLSISPDGYSCLDCCLVAAMSFHDIALIGVLLTFCPSSHVKYKAPEEYARSALSTALLRSRSDLAWTRIVEQLASFYTVDELESESFLLEAVVYNSIIGCRVLLQLGVNVDRVYSWRGMEGIALHCSRSDDVLSVLVDHGADVLTKDPLTHTNAIEGMLSNRLKDTTLEMLLRREQPTIVYAAILHTTLIHYISTSQKFQDLHAEDIELRQNQANKLRQVLRHPKLIPYVNSPDENGTTLIQYAAIRFHMDSVRLLLDAGADANIAYSAEGSSMLPLQLCCCRARTLLYFEAMQHDPSQIRPRVESTIQAIKDQALPVATELLRWHRARGDELFKGINEYHLACRMFFPSERLERIRSANKRLDPGSKGFWPGVTNPVTAKELLKMDLLSEFDTMMSFPLYPSSETGFSAVNHWFNHHDPDDEDSASLYRSELERVRDLGSA